MLFLSRLTPSLSSSAVLSVRGNERYNAHHSGSLRRRFSGRRPGDRGGGVRLVRRGWDRLRDCLSRPGHRFVPVPLFPFLPFTRPLLLFFEDPGEVVCAESERFRLLSSFEYSLPLLSFEVFTPYAVVHLQLTGLRR